MEQLLSCAVAKRNVARRSVVLESTLQLVCSSSFKRDVRTRTYCQTWQLRWQVSETFIAKQTCRNGVGKSANWGLRVRNSWKRRSNSLSNCDMMSEYKPSDVLVRHGANDCRAHNFTSESNYRNEAIRPRRSRSAAAYSRQTFPWTICRSVRTYMYVSRASVGLSSALWKNGESDPDAVWHH